MPKVIDHDQRRVALLEQCLQLFAERGYAGLTMRQIAKELGVTTGVLYHYFPSKEVLFEKLAAYLTEQDILGALQEVPPEGSKEDKVRSLMRFVEANEAYFVRQLLLLSEIYRVREGDEAGTLEAVQKATRHYVTAIDQALDLGDAALSRFVFIFIGGLVLQRYLDGADTSFEEQQDVLVRLLSGGSAP